MKDSVLIPINLAWGKTYITGSTDWKFAGEFLQSWILLLFSRLIYCFEPDRDIKKNCPGLPLILSLSFKEGFLASFSYLKRVRAG